MANSFEVMHKRLRLLCITHVKRSPTRIWAFFFLTFAWSWTCWLLSTAVKPQLPSLAMMLMFAGSFGPCMAAVLVVANAGGRAGLRAWFGRCLQWRIGWGWMALALLLPAALMAAAAAVHVALGGQIEPSSAAGHALMTAANFFLVFGGPLGEELSWRGYALPSLQDRCDWRVASLGLGLVWGVWHLPLFFMDGTSQALTPLALFLLGVVAMSVVFAWLVNRTAGGVVAATLFDTGINFWPSIIPMLPTDESYRPYALLVVMLVLLALGLLTQPNAAGPHSSTLS